MTVAIAVSTGGSLTGYRLKRPSKAVDSGPRTHLSFVCLVPCACVVFVLVLFLFCSVPFYLFHFVLFRSVYFVMFCSIPFRFSLFRFALFRFTLFRFDLFPSVSLRFFPFRSIPFHFIPFRSVPFRFFCFTFSFCFVLFLSCYDCHSDNPGFCSPWALGGLAGAYDCAGLALAGEREGCRAAQSGMRRKEPLAEVHAQGVRVGWNSTA